MLTLSPISGILVSISVLVVTEGLLGIAMRVLPMSPTPNSNDAHTQKGHDNVRNGFL